MAPVTMRFFDRARAPDGVLVGVCSDRSERIAILDLRDRGEITDDTLRRIERDLDLDELRREA